MDYIVLDLEWNQSNNGTEAEIKDMPFEIVEIGAVKLNADFEITDTFNRLIKPQVYREMNYITKKLIHITMKDLESESFFPEVAHEFLQWCGSNSIFCTWGPLDLMELQRNMRHYGFSSLAEGPLKFYDVQKLFSISFEDRKSRRTLEYAVDFLKMEKDIPFHRAFADAYYTAKVLCRLERSVFSNYSFDNFSAPKNKKEEVYAFFDSYMKYISREFENKQEALSDREVKSTKCYLCGKNIRRKIKWFSLNGKHYYCVYHCSIHGNIKAKVRIRKSEDDKVYVVKTVKLISQEEAENWKNKQERAKDQNRVKTWKKK